MKQIIITILCLMVLAGISSSQSVSVSSFTGLWDDGGEPLVRTNRLVTWTINIETPAGGIMSSTNGFAVYLSSDGTPFGLLYPGPGFMPIAYNTLADFSNYATYSQQAFGIDGFGIDTIGFGGVSFGDPVVINGPTWTITTMVDTTLIGNYLCLDTTWFPPGGAWIWNTSSGPVIPSWDGSYCYRIQSSINHCCNSPCRSIDYNWVTK